MRDPYDVLGVNKGADAKEVKKAYRKLARELHPDLHPGDAKAEERFKEVAAAYDFLSDADKKAKFDRGEIDASGAPRYERQFYRTYADGEPGARYHDPREFFHGFEGFNVFSDLFGGAAGGGRAGPMRVTGWTSTSSTRSTAPPARSPFPAASSSRWRSRPAPRTARCCSRWRAHWTPCPNPCANRFVRR